MSKKHVLVQAPHVILDAEGRQMSPGHDYNVAESELILSYISEGFLTIIESAPEKEIQQEIKKTAVPTKNVKTQETESTNLTGEL